MPFTDESFATMNTIEHARATLSVLEGEWEGHGEIHPNPWGGIGPTRTKWTFAWDYSRVHLLCDCLERRHDGSQFAAHGVLGIDPGSHAPLWWLFDTYGYPPLAPAQGQWAGDTLVLIKETPRGTGRTAFAVRESALHVSIDSRAAEEAEFTRVMSGVFARTRG